MIQWTSFDKLKCIYQNLMRAEGLGKLEEWKASEDGLRASIETHGRSQSKKEIRQLRLKLRDSRDQAWESACEQAWSYDYQTRTCKNRLGSASHLDAAEKICLGNLHIPRSFSLPFHCSKCGWVLVKKPELPCPWCSTSLPQVLETLRGFEDRLYLSRPSFPLP